MSDDRFLAAAPELETFWAAVDDGRLLLPRCDACSFTIWYPRPYCPQCGSTAVTWVESTGRGSIYSYTVDNRPALRALSAGTEPVPDPRVVAYVELDEGPRVVTNVVDTPLDSLAIGLAVEAVFPAERGSTPPLVMFRAVR